MGKNEIEKAPSFGYSASQGVYYYGYKILIGGAEVHHLYFVLGTEVAPISVFLFSLIFRFIEILLPGIRTFPSRAIVFEFSSRTALECLWIIGRARTYSRW